MTTYTFDGTIESATEIAEALGCSMFTIEVDTLEDETVVQFRSPYPANTYCDHRYTAGSEVRVGGLIHSGAFAGRQFVEELGQPRDMPPHYDWFSETAKARYEGARSVLQGG